jgi:spore coat protein A, manganese oxidase
MTRRAIAAGALLAFAVPTTTASGAPKMTTRLAPYAQPLPALAVAQPSSPNAYTLSIKRTARRMHPKLPAATTVYGYDDGTGTVRSPGPVIAARRGTPVTVTWNNTLAGQQHIFPSAAGDPITSMGLGSTLRTLAHLHGGLVLGTSDGNPYATPAPEPASITDVYPNEQAAALRWYHDHALGQTRLNPYAGLAGGYLQRDAYDTGEAGNVNGFPAGRYELPLIVQDKQFDTAGQLWYPPAPWVPEFFGNETVVNGAVEPFVNVEPRKYRIRTLNGSNARFYNLEWVTPAGANVPIRQIGAEDGLFGAPALLRQSLIMPGERADLVVDFAAYAGQTLTLRNAPLPKGVVSPAPRLATVMEFRVGTSVTSTAGNGAVPSKITGADLPNLAGVAPARVRNITLEEQLNAAGAPIRLLLNGKTFHDPVTERPAAGSVEEWRFVNVSADTHPMHLHLSRFQVIGRRTYNAALYNADLLATRAAGQPAPDPLAAKYTPGPLVAAKPSEAGWKDTVGSNPNEITYIRVKFDVPAGATLPQRYVYHCHILEHEENDMMRPIEVV